MSDYDGEPTGDGCFPVMLALAAMIMIIALWNDSSQVIDPRAPMDPPSALTWTSEEMRDDYTVLYGFAVEACETPPKERQPNIDVYAKQRQLFATKWIADESAPSPPTPERLLSC